MLRMTGDDVQFEGRRSDEGAKTARSRATFEGWMNLRANPTLERNFDAAPLAPNAPLEILFCDAHCLVVAKPARLLTASDETGDETLIARARAWNSAQQAEGKKGYLAPLHMLDRPVSGVVMFARSSKAASRLADDFRCGKIRKTYRALVEGAPPAAVGEETIFADWLIKDREQNRVRVTRSGEDGAKACRLGVKVLGAKGSLTLLELTPLTGRSHQIRVQLASRGFPILGDLRYGSHTAFDHAIALHALSVSFEHPVTKVMTTVTTPPPAAWRSVFPAAVKP